jgi:hypothetical protein
VICGGKNERRARGGGRAPRGDGAPRTAQPARASLKTRQHALLVSAAEAGTTQVLPISSYGVGMTDGSGRRVICAVAASWL